MIGEAFFDPGWTMTTPQTGYAAPLGVRFRQHDGETVAMAESDVAVALLRGDGSLEQVLAPGVTLFGLAFVPRLLRRTRAPGAESRTSGYAACRQSAWASN